MSDRDNQQRRIGWLAGLIDGEGSVTVIYSSPSKRHPNGRFVPSISITNTDPVILEEASKILKELKIAFRVNKKTRVKGWKPCKYINIRGIKRCFNACNKLSGILIGDKKDRLEMMRKWCESRLSKPHCLPYTEEETEMLDAIRQSSISLRDYTSKRKRNYKHYA